MPHLHPFIDQEFNGQVWKFVIDGKAGLLFAEIRDQESRQVSFASINLNTSNINFKELAILEKWLTGLESCFDGTLFLHGYQSAQSPNHKAIMAVNGLTGDELWSNYIYAITYISINGPIAYNTQIQPPAYFLLDGKTGATLRALDASIDLEANPDIKLPDILTTIPSEFNSLFEGDAVGNLYYMEHNGFRIVSLHTTKNGKLQQTLLITKNGSIVYSDVINEKIQKLQPEAFMMHQNQLMYIKNAKVLKVLNL